jgi:glutathione S-transferase
MLTVYHLAGSRADRILWLLEELGTPYEVVRFERDPQTQRAPAALRDVHPLGKSPMIREDGRLIVESGAIVEYVLERHGKGRLAPAAGSPARARYLQWLHFAEGSAMASLVLLMFLDGTIPGSEPSPLADSAREAVATQLGWIEAELGSDPYLAGADFSAADVMMTMPIALAASRGLLEGRPNLQAYLARVTAREAYRKATEAAAG